MKKKLIVAAATLLSASTAFAGGPEILPIEDYFSGFYVGGNISGQFMKSKQTAQLDMGSQLDVGPTLVTPIEDVFLPIPQVLLSGDGGAADVFGGIQGGFNWTFNHQWVLGLEGFGNWGNLSSTTSTTVNSVNAPLVNNVNQLIPFVPVNSDSNTNSNTVTLSTTTKIDSQYGLKGKLGWLVTPTTMIYGVIGAEWADLKVTTNANGAYNVNAVSDDESITSNGTFTGSESSSSTKVSVLAGGGIEQFVYQDIVSFFVEYDYSNFATVNVGPSDVTTSISGSTTVDGHTETFGDPTPLSQPIENVLTGGGNATVNAVQGGINVYFGRNWL